MRVETIIDGTLSGTRRNVGSIACLFVVAILAGHLVIAALYWWLSPKGFPIAHCRFWLNSVIPVAVSVMLAVGLFAILRQRFQLSAICLIACVSAWAVATLSGRLLFPISLGKLWLAGLFPVILVTGAVLCLLRVVRLPVWAWLCSTLVGGCLGLFVVWAQVPPGSDTTPADEITASDSKSGGLSLASPLVKVGEGDYFEPRTAELSLDCGSVKLRCSPLLTFDRISPDGFWSLLAPPRKDERKPASCTVAAGSCDCRYSDGSSVKIVAPDAQGYVHLNASTTVGADTYSHLNAYCVLSVAGHRKLSLAFSPCRESLIEVMPADYPTGRPARFGYVDDTDTFHVVEATSGEKGPFKQLASGPLRLGEPLTIFFYDEGLPIASVTVDDWTSQLSRALSPTAGWGIPANAIEFQRLGSSEDSAVQIWITLAATSVGRGWECVGHRGGIYRNRVTFNTGAF